MCDRYSFEYGYICDECFEELTYKNYRTDVGEFMASKKQKDVSSYKVFNQIFPLRL